MTKNKTRVERTLSAFGPSHAAALVDFFAKVADADFDVVIFMARKSMCIYRMMQYCGAKKPTSEVYSDSIVDFGTEQFAGKSVLIVDDTLFVGTTLTEANARFIDSDVSKLEFWVFCVDVDTWDQKNFNPDYIHLRMREQEVIEFCAAECRGLINAAVPYLTDFLTSGRIPLSASALDQIIRPSDWNLFDISSQFHNSNDVKYYTGLPDQSALHKIEDEIGSEVFNLMEIVKVRLFSTWTGRYYETSFVPVVTLGAMTHTALERAFECVCQKFDLNLLLFKNSSLHGKLRTLQFLIGAAVFKTWWSSINNIYEPKIAKKIDAVGLRSAFSPEISEHILASLEVYLAGKPLKQVAIPEGIQVASEPPEAAQETRDDFTSFLASYFSSDSYQDDDDTPLSDLTAIFLEFHRRFESAAREEISNGVLDPKFKNRLKRGMAWNTLSATLLSKHHLSEGQRNRQLLSLILDRLIDYGIAVPITVVSHDRLYRAYRHGEDVRFGAQEENLVYKILEGFETGREHKGFEGTYLEKLIVLLLRVGMKEEWLTLWYSASGADTLVRVGYNLQGAVAIAPKLDTTMVPEDSTSWLSRRLCRQGVIKQPVGSHKFYTLGYEPDAAHARHDAERTAKQLGIAIGSAVIKAGTQRNAERPISSKDLIVITSCSNLLDVSGAIAAETQIFSQWVAQDFGALLSGEKKYSAMDAAARIRQLKSSKANQAVNSGLWKIRKFESDAFGKVSAKIRSALAGTKNGVFALDIWEDILSACSREVSTTDKQKLEGTYKEHSEILDKARLSLILIEICLILDQKDVKQFDKLSDLASKHLDDFKKVLPRNAMRFIEHLVTRTKDSPLISDERTSSFFGKVHSVVLRVSEVGSIEAQTTAVVLAGSDRRLSRKVYTHVLWYDIIDSRSRKQGTIDATDSHASSVRSFMSDANSLVKDRMESIRARNGDVFACNGDEKSQNDSKHIYFSGGSSEQDALNFASDLGRLANRNAIELRAIVSKTDLRGEYVFLNKGETTVDGDFLNHLHCIVQKVENSSTEMKMEKEQMLLWFVGELGKTALKGGTLNSKFFDAPQNIVVSIRGVETSETVTPMILR